MSSLFKQLCSINPNQWIAKACASGRWYPQPDITSNQSKHTFPFRDTGRNYCTESKCSKVETVQKGNVLPIYAKPRAQGKRYNLVPFKNDVDGNVEMIADYPLFESALKEAEISYKDYEKLSPDDRSIYMAHLKAIQDRQLTYKDPKTKLTVMAVTQHLYKAKCCGSGCRHCPYEHINAKPQVRQSKSFNGAFYF